MHCEFASCQVRAFGGEPPADWHRNAFADFEWHRPTSSTCCEGSDFWPLIWLVMPALALIPTCCLPFWGFRCGSGVWLNRHGRRHVTRAFCVSASLLCFSASRSQVLSHLAISSIHVVWPSHLCSHLQAA